MKKIIYLLFILLCCSFVLANDLSLYEARCFKDGSGEITVKSSNEDYKIDTEEIKFSAEYQTWYGLAIKNSKITGSWEDDQTYIVDGMGLDREYGKFIVDEAVFRGIGDYIIKLEYPDADGETKQDTLKFTCEGMIFSCSLLGIEVESCKTTDNKKFEAVVKVSGLNQSKVGKLDLYSDIVYSLKAKNKYEDIRGEFSETGSLPKGFSVVEKEGKYYFDYEFEDNFIYSVVAKFVGLDECRDTKKYPALVLYSHKECELFETKKEVIEDTPVEKAPIVEEINDSLVEKDIKNSENNYSWLIGILIAIIGILIAIIIVILKKQKANKWWIN